MSASAGAETPKKKKKLTSSWHMTGPVSPPMSLQNRWKSSRYNCHDKQKEAKDVTWSELKRNGTKQKQIHKRNETKQKNGPKQNDATKPQVSITSQVSPGDKVLGPQISTPKQIDLFQCTKATKYLKNIQYLRNTVGFLSICRLSVWSLRYFLSISFLKVPRTHRDKGTSNNDR